MSSRTVSVFTSLPNSRPIVERESPAVLGPTMLDYTDNDTELQADVTVSNRSTIGEGTICGAARNNAVQLVIRLGKCCPIYPT